MSKKGTRARARSTVASVQAARRGQAAEAMRLEDNERIMMEGVEARRREIQQTYLAPLERDAAAVLAQIEQRLGLPAGSFQSGAYGLRVTDTGEWRVERAPKQTAETPADGSPQPVAAPARQRRTRGEGKSSSAVQSAGDAATGQGGASGQLGAGIPAASGDDAAATAASSS